MNCKSVLISIKPEWVEKILDGSKTIEIRKSMPKCKLPCKVYIYETKDKVLVGDHFERVNTIYFGGKATYRIKKDYYYGQGKVVAEFTLNKIDIIDIYDPTIWLDGQQFDINEFENKCCLTADNLMEYIGYGSEEKYSRGYAWYIDNLIVYDEPKWLNEFIKPANCNNKDFETFDNNKAYYWKCLQKAPQSWCYVQTMEAV